ncbi:MAG: hypothetical protein ACOC2C_07715 [Cyclonatronaceae bacterium]
MQRPGSRDFFLLPGRFFNRCDARRMMHVFQAFYRLTAVAALSVLLAGCGIFETRTPESPGSGDGNAGFRQPDQPDLVIENLQAAINDMNSLNYMRNFVEAGQGFSFTPSSAALDNDPSIWQNWSREDESAYFNNLVTATQNRDGHSLAISDLERITLPEGGERITASYTLTLMHNRTDSGIPTVARGNFLMDVVQDENGLWYVQSWTDNASGSSFTWSDIKASFLRE